MLIVDEPFHWEICEWPLLVQIEKFGSSAVNHERRYKIQSSWPLILRCTSSAVWLKCLLEGDIIGWTLMAQSYVDGGQVLLHPSLPTSMDVLLSFHLHVQCMWALTNTHADTVQPFVTLLKSTNSCWYLPLNYADSVKKYRFSQL